MYGSLILEIYYYRMF